MLKGLIGKKVGMTQILDDTGTATPVTLIEAGPCYVTYIRKPAKEGYAAVQLGFEEIKQKRLTGGQMGHLVKSEIPPLRFLREFRGPASGLKMGDRITVDVFSIGDWVDIIGTSKGKGFQGTMKRHGFKGGPITHGQSDRQRSPGSIGATTTPGHVFKGLRGPGRMGNSRVTSQNVKVVLVDPERNLIGIRGSVPGYRGTLVLIKDARKQ